MVRPRTLAVLQVAFSTVLAACAQSPQALTPSEPSAPPEAPVPTPGLSATTSPPVAAPAPTSTADGQVAAPVMAPVVPAFVEGNPNTRSAGQLCLGKVVPSLRPGRPVDSLEMRVLQRRSQQVEIVVTGRAGSPCGTAKDQAACQRAYEAARPPSNEEIFVFTRGDEVGILARADVPAFLAPIDSPEEAAMVMAYAPPTDQAAASCDPANVKPSWAGFTTTHEVGGRCEHDVLTYAVSKEGKSRLVGKRHVVAPRPCRMAVKGRTPAGLVPAPPSEGAQAGSLGAHLAEACVLEAASVISFRRLERELGSLGAPRSLTRRALASARDEARHARIMRRLARRAGIEPRAPRIARIAPRAAVDIAIENATEGCVRETWAALVARYQADHATAGELRAAMQIIARDEAKHAALAWDVHAWLDDRLSDDERARVREAYDQALAELVHGADEVIGEVDRIALGLPSAETSQALANAWASRIAEGVLG